MLGAKPKKQKPKQPNEDETRNWRCPRTGERAAVNGYKSGE